MTPQRRPKTPFPNATGEYHVLVIEDRERKIREIRKGTVFWSREDEVRQANILNWLDSLVDLYPAQVGARQRFSEKGERGSYIAAFGLGVHLGAAAPAASTNIGGTV